MNDIYMYALMALIFGGTTAWTARYEKAEGTASNAAWLMMVAVFFILAAIVLLAVGLFKAWTPAMG